MAQRYYLSSTNSDLSTSSLFNKVVLSNVDGSPTALSVSVAQASTATGHWFTTPLNPGTKGSVTGDFTLSIDVTTSSADISMYFYLSRVNSSGTVQTTSSNSSTILLDTTGVKTLSLSSVDLGTFTSTDRLLTALVFTNAALHSTRSVGINQNTSNTFVTTPFITKFFSIT